MKLLHFGKVIPGEASQKAWFSVLKDRDSWVILIAMPGKAFKESPLRRKILEQKPFAYVRLEFGVHWCPVEDL